jgi:hypothetical protein
MYCHHEHHGTMHQISVLASNHNCTRPGLYFGQFIQLSFIPFSFILDGGCLMLERWIFTLVMVWPNFSGVKTYTVCLTRKKHWESGAIRKAFLLQKDLEMHPIPPVRNYHLSKPESRRMSSCRTSSHRSARRKGNIPRPSRMTSGRWQEVSTEIGDTYC